MEQITPFDIRRIFIGGQPPLFMLEIVFRVIVIYVAALLMTRLLGKRGRSEMTPLEYIIIFALGSAIGDPMLYPSVPLTWSILIMLTIVILEQAIIYITNKSSRFRKFVESEPMRVIEFGQFIQSNVDGENFNKPQIMELLREQGIPHTNILKYVYLEPSGKLSVIKKESGTYKNGVSTLPEDSEA